jgi:hypothetical protein
MFSEDRKPVVDTRKRGTKLNPEDTALLEAFHRMGDRERRKFIIEAKYRADLAEIDREYP